MKAQLLPLVVAAAFNVAALNVGYFVGRDTAPKTVIKKVASISDASSPLVIAQSGNDETVRAVVNDTLWIFTFRKHNQVWRLIDARKAVSLPN